MPWTPNDVEGHTHKATLGPNAAIDSIARMSANEGEAIVEPDAVNAALHS